MLSNLYKTNQFAEYQNLFQPVVSRTREGLVSFKHLPSGNVYRDVDTRKLGGLQTGGAESNDNETVIIQSHYIIPEIIQTLGRRNPVSRLEMTNEISIEKLRELGMIQSSRFIYFSLWVGGGSDVLMGTGPFPNIPHDKTEQQAFLKSKPSIENEVDLLAWQKQKENYLNTLFIKDYSPDKLFHVVMNDQQKSILREGIEHTKENTIDQIEAKLDLSDIFINTHATSHIFTCPFAGDDAFHTRFANVINHLKDNVQSIDKTVLNKINIEDMDCHIQIIDREAILGQGWVKKRYQCHVWFPLHGDLEAECEVIQTTSDNIRIHIQ